MSSKGGSHGGTGFKPTHMLFKQSFITLTMVLATCFVPVWAQSLIDKNSLDTAKPTNGSTQTNTGVPNYSSTTTGNGTQTQTSAPTNSTFTNSPKPNASQAQSVAKPCLSASENKTAVQSMGAMTANGVTTSCNPESADQRNNLRETRSNNKFTDTDKSPPDAQGRNKNRNKNSLKKVDEEVEAATVNTLKDNIPLPPETEFQRFVLSTTGQSLPLFGYELFEGNDLFKPVEAAAVPPAYVLSPGDELVVQINGLIEVNERLVIDREGRILLPKIGPVNMAGVVLKDAERVLGNHVAKMYRNFSVSVSMGRLRSIEIFVVGQAKKPGKHMVSSLSSLINALFETGGPGVNGSLRAVTLKRQGKAIATVDMYAFLSQGDNSNDVSLMTGDLIYIPPAGARVALLGSVNTPAVYELLGTETIGHMLSLSGGLPALAAPQQAQLERVDTRRTVARYVEDVALDDSGLSQRMQAGDVLTVLQISPQIDNAVTLTGNVDTPLRYTYKPGMRVADVLKDKRLLIAGSYWEELNKGIFSNKYSRPEVNLDYATVQRLDKQSLRTVLLPFNLLKAMANDPQENLALQKGDVVKVYGPQDLLPETDNSVSVSGDIVGGTKRFVWRPGFTIKDVIPSTQWLVDYYGYWQREFARDLYNDINWDYAVVNRRVPATLQTQAITFNLGNAVLRDMAQDNIGLQPGDEIQLFTTTQMPTHSDNRNQLVSLMGEVMVPGKYQIRAGETLTELVQRAGGLSRNAYVFGTQFLRESIKQQQQDNIDRASQKMQAQIEAQAAVLKQSATEADKLQAQAQLVDQQQMLKRVSEIKASGRISLDLDPENPLLPALTLTDGDSIFIPTRPGMVGVFGEVFTETSQIHRPGMTVGSTLTKAGVTKDADSDNILLIRADGTVISNASQTGWWGKSINHIKLQPGDSVYVPSMVDKRTAYSLFIQGAKDWTTILYQLSLGAVGIKTLRSN